MTATILIVDDDPAIRWLISAILDQKGYKTLTASGVKEALEVIDQQMPDLVCCDLVMPQADGIDFLEYCRQTPKLANLAVIIISAAGEEEMVDRARELGAYACLGKPFSRAYLLELIMSALER
jgi:CheY-like chemotaxis protein